MTALKLMAFWQADDQTSSLQIIPPCEGYYTNLRMQYLTSHSGEDPVFFWAGTKLANEVRDEIVVSGAMNVVPDYGKNGVHSLFTTNQPIEGEVVREVTTEHFKNKRINIGAADFLRIFTKTWSDQSSVDHWILTGDFVPKKGSLFQMEVDIYTMLVSNNWFNSPITIPVTIENATIEAVVNGPADNSDTTQGYLKVRKFAKDHVVLENELGGSSFGDIVTNVHTAGAARRTMDKNALLNVDFSFVSGGSNMAKGRKAVKLLTQGEVIGTDIVVMDGSTVDLDVTIRITGRVKYQDSSNDANFLEGAGIQNLNIERAGT